MHGQQNAQAYCHCYVEYESVQNEDLIDSVVAITNNATLLI